MSLYTHSPTNSLLLVCLSFIECVDVYSLLFKSPSGDRKHTTALRNVDLWAILVFTLLVNLGGKLISYKPAIDLTGLQDILLYFKIIWYCKRFFPLLLFFTVAIHFPVSIFFLLLLDLEKLSENKNKEEEILEKVALGHPRFSQSIIMWVLFHTPLRWNSQNVSWITMRQSYKTIAVFFPPLLLHSAFDSCWHLLYNQWTQH